MRWRYSYHHTNCYTQYSHFCNLNHMILHTRYNPDHTQSYTLHTQCNLYHTYRYSYHHMMLYTLYNSEHTQSYTLHTQCNLYHTDRCKFLHTQNSLYTQNN